MAGVYLLTRRKQVYHLGLGTYLWAGRWENVKWYPSRAAVNKARRRRQWLSDVLEPVRGYRYQYASE